MLFEIIGWVGAGAVLAAYFLFSLGRIRNGVRYQVLNLVGALALIANALAGGSWPFVILNVVWAATAIFTLARFAIAAKKPADDPTVAI